MIFLNSTQKKAKIQILFKSLQISVFETFNQHERALRKRRRNKNKCMIGSMLVQALTLENNRLCSTSYLLPLSLTDINLCVLGIIAQQRTQFCRLN